MRIACLVLLASTAALAQSNDRGSVSGTGHHPVTPLTAEPRVVWDTKTGYRDSVGMVASGQVLVTGNPNGTGGTYAYDLATGKRLWRVPGHIRGTPAVDDTSAYAVNALPKGFRFRLSKLDLKTGKAQWSYDDENLGGGTPLLVGNVVVLVSENKRIITALDRATGARLWRRAPS